ncbi:MAG: hypothetical protein U0359_02310 [Byssovorax sp.]
MSRGAFGLFFALGIASLGCGARSALPGGEGAGGSAASTSTSAGSGGSGPCTTPVRRETIVLHPDTTDRETDPALSLASDDGTFVIVLYGALPENPTVSLVPALLHTAMAPWNEWPPKDIGSIFPLSNSGGASFRVARHPGDLFAALYDDDPSPEPHVGVTLATQISLGASGASGAIVASPQASVARFLTEGEAHLVGAQRGGGPAGAPKAYQLDGAWSAETAAGTKLGVPIHFGCATTPMVADARRSGDGALVAFANGAPLGGAACLDGDPIGAATQIQIARVDREGDAVKITPGATIGALGGDFTLAVPSLALASRPGGSAFLAWYEAQSGPGDASPGIRAAAVDASGQLTGGPFPVTGSVTGMADRPYDGGFAIDSAGDRLIVAWLNDPSSDFDAAPRIIVEELDAQGHVLFADDLPADGLITGPLAVLASPSGTSFLVAWSASPNAGTATAFIHVTRYDCAAP